MNDLIMLATLVDGPKHGYQLKREAGLIFGDAALHNNLVYPLLRGFTNEGWVTKKAVPGDRGQTKHQYSITALGKKALVARLSEFGELEAKSFEAFALRVGMFGLLDQEVRLKILDNRKAHLEQRHQRLAALPENLDIDGFGAEVIKFMNQRAQAELSWIKHIRRLAKSEAS
jgi:DNA-binding PadR family transcriptional regulator